MILLRNFGIDGATFVAVLSLIGNGVQMWIGMKKDAASNELAKLKENNNFELQKYIANNNLKDHQEERNLKFNELKSKLNEQHFNMVSDRMKELFENYLTVTGDEITHDIVFDNDGGVSFSDKQKKLELLVLMYCPAASDYINKIHQYKPFKGSETIDNPNKAYDQYFSWLSSLAIIFNKTMMQEQK